MKNPRTIAIVIGALLLTAVGALFFRGPKPIIEIKGEKLFDIGPLPVLNTYVTSITVVIVLIILAVLATRTLHLIPRGLQNAVEAVVDALYTVCINTAGEKNGRRFFPVIMTIFTFIWIANWMALLPFFNAIGQVQKVDAHHFHEEAVVFSNAAGIGVINLNEKAIEFEVEATEGWQTVEELEAAIDDAKLEGAPEEAIDELELAHEDALTHAQEEAIAVELPNAAGIDVDTTECDGLEDTEAKETCEHEANLAHAEEAAAKLEADNKEIGILLPYFRSMNTDINSPLSIAVMAMIFIEFWGITALGVFKYGSKFINFSSPINFIVGFLELIAELARLISFSFRLFGNMLAGEILLLVMTFLIPFVLALPFYGLEVFVGLIQAFVFAMLTLVFGVLATSAPHGDHEGGEHEEGAHIESTPEGVPAT